jgi:energy-coupling factor transport system ATP-binding protein
MTLVAEYCQRVVSFRNGLVTFNGSPAELFSDPDLLVQTGLRAPSSATLANLFRATQPELPPLLTVSHWVDALASQLQPEMKIG